MEIYGSVQPLVLTRRAYAMLYGEDDPEELSLMQLHDRAVAQAIDDVMRLLYYTETDLAAPKEGEGLSEEIGTEEELEELRRIAAGLHNKTPEEYQEGGVPVGFQFNHLINHASDSGYYLPVEFPQAFVMQDISIGSAVVLLQELEALEPVLTTLYPDQISQARSRSDEEEPIALEGPVKVWDALIRLCRSAIELGMPIVLDT